MLATPLRVLLTLAFVLMVAASAHSQTYQVLQGTAPATGTSGTKNGNVMLVGDYASVAATISGTFTSGTVIFEGSTDYFVNVVTTIFATNYADQTQTTSPTVVGTWNVPCAGFLQIRSRFATVVGTVLVTGRPSAYILGGKKGGGGPADATYITQTPNATLTNEQALSALSTGLVKNTTTTGVLSIGAAGTDYVAPGGAGSVSGLTINTLPKATSSTALGNSLASDDGTNFTVQSIGTVSIGDPGAAGNNTYLQIDDANSLIKIRRDFVPTSSGGASLGTASLPFASLLVSTAVQTPIIKPSSDSTTAVRITKADGSTAFVTFDSTNKRVGINKTPGAFDLDVNGAVNLGSTLAVSGVVTAGSGPTTLTDAAGKILSAALNTVGVAQGGTGLATLTANNVILGNGTSTPGFVAPSTSGNVLTSNGTTWTSAAPAGGGITIGTTTITSGTDTRSLYNNAGVVGERVVTGTGNAVLSASPTGTGTWALAAITGTTLRLSNNGFGATNSALLLGGINAGLGLTGSNLYLQVPTASEVVYMGTVTGGSTEFLFGMGTNPRLTIGGDVGLARNGAGIAEINSGVSGTLRDLKLRNITAYGNATAIATAGWGVPAIYAAGRATAQTAANSSIATYTVGAADGSFIVSTNVNVTTSTAHTFSIEVAYTDETNTARTLTFNVQQLGGTLVTSITNVTGAGPYEGVPLHIRCKASTAITIRTNSGGTYTTVTYNAEGVVQQIA